MVQCDNTNFDPTLAHVEYERNVTAYVYVTQEKLDF